LTGLSTDDIISSMKAFKTDQRKGTIMNRIAKGYSDEEIDLMASIFPASLTPQASRSGHTTGIHRRNT